MTFHAILITTPSGQHILVDGGASPEKVAYELEEALPYWEEGDDLRVIVYDEEGLGSGYRPCRHLCDGIRDVSWLLSRRGVRDGDGEG